MCKMNADYCRLLENSSDENFWIVFYEKWQVQLMDKDV